MGGFASFPFLRLTKPAINCLFLTDLVGAWLLRGLNLVDLDLVTVCISGHLGFLSG
jgi:hypothetical protein